MGLKERITSDMTAAMKAKDAGRLSTLRMVKAAMQNREIEKGGEAGGHVVIDGTPEEVARDDSSYTGRALRQVLASGRPNAYAAR